MQLTQGAERDGYSFPQSGYNGLHMAQDARRVIGAGLTRIQQHIQDREQTWNGPDL